MIMRLDATSDVRIEIATSEGAKRDRWSLPVVARVNVVRMACAVASPCCIFKHPGDDRS
jgi:hypothetical protein